MRSRSKSGKNAGVQPPGRSGPDKKSGAHVAPGQRQLRVGERIRHILSDIMRRGGLRDPALQDTGMITVTAVDIGPDLQHAAVFVMPLGGNNSDEIVEALNRASGYFRSEMARELDLRYTPKLSFKIDRSFDEAAHIDKLLGRYEIRKDVDKQDDNDGDLDSADND